MKKLSPFLEKIKELLIDKKSYHLVGYWGMQKEIKNWPTIEYKEGGYAPDDEKNGGELEKQTLDLENCEFNVLDKDKMIFTAGGDWQYPYTVTVKLKDGKLTVTDSHPYKKREYKDLSYKDIIHILQAEDLLEEKKSEEALKDAKLLIDKTKENWSSKDVDTIIKQIKDSDEYIKSGTWTLIKDHLKNLIPNELEINVLKECLENYTGKKVILKEELPKDNTEEGKLLIAALAKITTESQTDKTPDEVFNQVKNLKTQIYNSSNDINKKSVVGIVLKDNFVLLGEAITDDDRTGWLCFPGGGVDEGESLLRAVKREVREEVNILAKFENQILITDPTKPNVFFFIGKYINGEIQYNSEFKNMNWYDLNNLPIEKIYPQNRQILNKMKNNLIFKNSSDNIMKDQILVIKESGKIKEGQIVESYVQTKKGILTGKQYIPKENFVYLNEKLNTADQEEVRKIVKKMLQTMFWRMYTRSSFITSE